MPPISVFDAVSGVKRGLEIFLTLTCGPDLTLADCAVHTGRTDVNFRKQFAVTITPNH